IEHIPAGQIEWHGEAERASLPDLGDGRLQALGVELVHAAELVVGAIVPPGRILRPLLPALALGHGLPPVPRSQCARSDSAPTLDRRAWCQDTCSEGRGKPGLKTSAMRRARRAPGSWYG